ncbi:hypothetical protein KKH23_06805 [Patescibacteria group bacterium]|uniref:Uncharacterized protein n=1 Tax=viral metagenome TaxID=1070528 RepID=A0A6M3LXG4_9ZZZZ|nr:hypothetical protein [Patescibacteria group bacterium]
METRWGLTAEEIEDIFATEECLNTKVTDYMMSAMEATLLHVVEEGEKPCPRDKPVEGHPITHFACWPMGLSQASKWECPECRAELKKEAGCG